MIDLGLEHVWQRPEKTQLWFRCGCIGILFHNRDEPTFATCALYRGGCEVGIPGGHDDTLCDRGWNRALPMEYDARIRLAELALYIRWIDDGGCPTHGRLH